MKRKNQAERRKKRKREKDRQTEMDIQTENNRHYQDRQKTDGHTVVQTHAKRKEEKIESKKKCTFDNRSNVIVSNEIR